MPLILIYKLVIIINIFIKWAMANGVHVHVHVHGHTCKKNLKNYNVILVIIKPFILLFLPHFGPSSRDTCTVYMYFYCARNCNEFFAHLLQVNITDHEKQTISKTESFITYKIETTVSLRT